jgi:iron complex transport system substrate-binding protein
MKRFLPFIAILIALTLTLTACQPAVAQETAIDKNPAIVVVDGLDREVTLEGPAETVVALAASNTETLFAIGAGDLVVGRDEFSDYPAEVVEIASVGGSMGEFNLEEIANLNPDLVLAAEINTIEFVESIEELGIPVFMVSNPKSFDEVYVMINEIGLLTGHEEGAAAVVEDMQARVAAVEEKVGAVDETPLVFFELDATDPAKPWTSGAGTFIDMIITMAGGENLGAALDGEWAQISQEELIVQNPDIILLADALWGVTPESVSERPGWDAISAVSEAKIFPFDGNIISRPGPRLADALEQMFEALHGETAE